jgi:hypothetical protein
VYDVSLRILLSLSIRAGAVGTVEDRYWQKRAVSWSKSHLSVGDGVSYDAIARLQYVS